MPLWIFIFAALGVSAAFVDLDSASLFQSRFLPAFIGLLIVITILKRRKSKRSRKSKNNTISSTRSGGEGDFDGRNDSEGSDGGGD